MLTMLGTIILTIIGIVLVLAALTVGVAMLTTGGVVFVILFIDIIVGVVFMVWLIKKLRNRKKNK